MTSYETIKMLEKRYHVHIDRDTFFDPLWRRECEDFKVYSMDGCCWDKVIGYRSLIHMLATDKEALKRIASREEVLDDTKMPQIELEEYL